MALEFKMEDTDVSICIGCDTLVKGGMDGCVQQSEQIFEHLLNMLDNNLVSLLRKAYEVQHESYFEMTDEDIVQALGQCIAANSGEKSGSQTVLSDETVAEILDEVFFYRRPVISTVQMNMFEGADSDRAEVLAKQYIADICTSYFEYIDLIKNKL